MVIVHRGLLVFILCASIDARANGAFPDAQQVLLPPDRPRRILVGTNFGLLASDDDGASWGWVCEEAIAPFPTLWQLAAPPAGALFAVSPNGLMRSGDLCDWTRAGGLLAGASPTDAFPDPNDARRILVAAVPRDGMGLSGELYESLDGGRTFDRMLYRTHSGTLLSSVEVPAGAPATIYLALLLYDPRDPRPSLARSIDGGRTFELFEQHAAVGGRTLRIAAVDPTNPQRLYLRAQGPSDDTIAISDDGGRTVRVVLQLATRATAFLRRPDGTLLVTTGEGDLHRSTDGGKTFARQGGGPRFRGLSERAGRIYAAADNLRDRFALGVSDDGGRTFRPVLALERLCGPAACVAAACATPWAVFMTRVAACLPDGGAPPDQAAPSDAGPPPPAPPAPGCACSLRPRADPAEPIAILLLLAGAATRRRRSCKSGSWGTPSRTHRSSRGRS